MNLLTIAEHDGGWLVSGDDAPIGFIAADRTVATPSGATYTVQGQPPRLALVSADGHPQVTLTVLTLRDEKTGVEWRLIEGWPTRARGGMLDLNEIWALPFSMEDAQWTVPNRVRLLLAWALTEPGADAAATQ